MSALRFTESKMVFSWDEADCLRIEKSETYTHLGSGVKVCEFIANESGTILFVEAKSSFSNPTNPGDFAANIEEICDKFRDSLLLFTGMLLGRPYPTVDLIPEHLGIDSLRGAKLRCFLIINGHENEWLHNVSDALNQRLAPISRAFAVDSVLAINERIALEQGLVKEFEARNEL
jgi:hypothetical protein